MKPTRSQDAAPHFPLTGTAATSTATSGPANSKPGQASGTAAFGARNAGFVSSDLAFLRSVAGMRALLTVLGAVGLLSHSDVQWLPLPLLLVPYLVWAAVLLRKTLGGWPHAASKLWP